MTKTLLPNPLFDEAPKFETVAAASDMGGAPRSPVSGKLMIRAEADGVPCWVDEDSRIVLPVLKS